MTANCQFAARLFGALAVLFAVSVFSAGLPQCRVGRHSNGVSYLSIDGEIVNPAHAWLTTPQVEYDRNVAAEAGIELIGIDLKEAGLWEHGYDYAKVDALIAHHLRCNPQAHLFLYTDFDGRYHRWWIKAHPEAWCRTEEGSGDIGAYNGRQEHLPSMGSPVWRAAYAELLRNLIRHVKAAPYAERVVGFHVASGISWEWLHWGSQSKQLCDYAPCAQEDFRVFLRTRYASDAALQAAWGRTDVTLATAAVPAGARRLHAANGSYYDPRAERDILDYHDYQHWAISRCIRELAHVIKEETEGRSLAGAFFGYTIFLHDAEFGQSTGHFDVRSVLDCPDVDYLVAPVAYSGRRPGTTTNTMGTAWSCNANGKLFFNHADFRTHRAPKTDTYYVDTREEAEQVIWRELARNLSEGNAIQFYDFSRGWTFGDKELCQTVRQCQELLGKYRFQVFDFPARDYLLVVVDERLMGRFQIDRPPLGNELVYFQLMNLTMAGIPWRCVLLSDLMRHEELQRSGAFLFLNLFRLDEETIAFLKRKVLTQGRLSIFMGPAGLLSPKGLTTKRIEALLGQPFRLETKGLFLRCEATAAWPSIQGVGWGVTDKRLRPYVLLPEKPAPAETIARLLDGTPSALYRERPECKVFWSAVPGLKPPVLRELARRGGIPVLADANDGIYAGCGFIGIHAHSDGVKRLRFPRPCAPREILGGRDWPAGTTEVTLRMKRGETRIFWVREP